MNYQQFRLTRPVTLVDGVLVTARQEEEDVGHLHEY